MQEGFGGALGPARRDGIGAEAAYRRAAAPVRKMLLERLLRPVGSLALTAIASGAFSAFLLRRVTLDDVARITVDQVAALARFVDQCNPEVLRQTRSMLA